MAGVQTQPLDIPKGIQASEARTIAAGSHVSERGRLYQPSSKVHRHLLVCELADRYRLLPCGRMPLVDEVCELVRGPAWVSGRFLFSRAVFILLSGACELSGMVRIVKRRAGEAPGAGGRIRTGEVLTRNQPLIPLKSAGIKPGETELPQIERRRAAPSFSLPGKVPMKWSFFKAYVTFYHDVLQKDKNKPVH